MASEQTPDSPSEMSETDKIKKRVYDDIEYMLRVLRSVLRVMEMEHEQMFGHPIVSKSCPNCISIIAAQNQNSLLLDHIWDRVLDV